MNHRPKYIHICIYNIQYITHMCAYICIYIQSTQMITHPKDSAEDIKSEGN